MQVIGKLPASYSLLDGETPGRFVSARLLLQGSLGECSPRSVISGEGEAKLIFALTIGQVKRIRGFPRWRSVTANRVPKGDLPLSIHSAGAQPERVIIQHIGLGLRP